MPANGRRDLIRCLKVNENCCASCWFFSHKCNRFSCGRVKVGINLAHKSKQMGGGRPQHVLVFAIQRQILLHKDDLGAETLRHDA